MHDINGSPDDITFMLDVQDEVQLFPETEAALQEQQNMGVKVLIYSDVERKYLDMYVSKFKTFKADFVGTTDEAGFHKPHAKTYFWVLRQTGLDIRDVLYCAGPTFDCQGAMAVNLITAHLQPDSGQILFEDRDITGLSVSDAAAMIACTCSRLLTLKAGRP